ncbi:MAG: Flp family type IVb pilin [Deltaproteobacteria bacterium]|nr:Flp family type IVb pilin [Deltaproteobacteria bacterium]
MKELTKLMVEFLQDEEGATMVEYGLMVALIAVVAIATVSLLGTEVDKTFTTVKDEMVTANGG